MMIIKNVAWLVLVYCLFIPLVASATVLDGQIVEYQYYYPDLSTPYPDPTPDLGSGNILVGPEVEVAKIDGGNFTGSLDISDSNLYVDFTFGTNFFIPSSFNGFRIADVFGTIPAFSSVRINPATNMIDFDSSRIAVDANHIWVNFSGLHFDQNTVVSLDIDAVPEPSTVALSVVGLLVLAGRRNMRISK